MVGRIEIAAQPNHAEERFPYLGDQLHDITRILHPNARLQKLIAGPPIVGETPVFFHLRRFLRRVEHLFGQRLKCLN